MIMENEWIIAVGGTEVDGVDMVRFTGTKAEAKKAVLRMVRKDIINDREIYDFGTGSVDDIEERGDGSLYAYSVFCSYHLDYVAVPLAAIPAYDRKGVV